MPKVHAFELGNLLVEKIDMSAFAQMPFSFVDNDLMHVKHCCHPWLDDVVIHQVPFLGVAIIVRYSIRAGPFDVVLIDKDWRPKIFSSC